MKKITDTSAFRAANSVLIVLAIALSACVANAAPPTFVEDFPGPGLDPAWSQEGDPAGHPGVIAGTYDLTDAFGAPGVTLKRSTPGTPSSFTQEIELVLEPFGLSGGGGTQTDVKFKSFGADGYIEIVLNSFGDMRLWHNDFNGGADNIQPNTNIGYTDGDLLKLTTVYDQGTDTIDLSYSLNGGPAIPFYSGGGLNGPIGDVITSFVQAQAYKWGSSATQAVVSIDKWRLVPVVPEPTSAALLAVASLYLIGRGSRGRRVARCSHSL